MDDDLDRRHRAAIDTLPPLTRAVYLLSSIDALTYREIAWRCGIDVAEVRIRLALGLARIDYALDGKTTVAMWVRATVLKRWRRYMARWRLQCRRRRIGITDRR